MNLDPNNPEDFASYEKCRSIHNEILNFGVSQKEILKLIELLSLELEDIILMKNINSVLKKDDAEEDKDLHEDNKIIL
tara:strand:+ start:1217 stop:1450 length:234 start_codon:yes stop_codon:yes gene_type:complete